MDKRKTTKFFFVFYLLLGFVGGVMAAVYLFAIDVDLMAIPYINKGVVLKEDLVLEQDNITLTIPKGSELLLVRRMPGANEYSVPLVVSWADETKTNELLLRPKPFRLKRATLKSKLP